MTAWRWVVPDALGEIFKHADGELAEPLRNPDDDPGAKEISTAVINACATARMTIDEESVEWKVPDLIRISPGSSISCAWSADMAA
jgi:hypothetical protein